MNTQPHRRNILKKSGHIKTSDFNLELQEKDFFNGIQY